MMSKNEKIEMLKTIRKRLQEAFEKNGNVLPEEDASAIIRETWNRGK